MNRKFKVACVQNNAGEDIRATVAQVDALVRAARASGAELICTSEHFSCLAASDRGLLERALPEDEHPALAHFRARRDLGAWLLLGSLAIRAEDDKFRNRSFLLDPSGNVVARYDKIHLFDVALDTGESYRESSTVQGGARAVVAPTPWGLLGLSVCYDLRFAYLYRALAQAGALFLSIPAAFTQTTGQAHWHVLQRARAIETGCYVFAPAQCGTHPGGRRTYGHALVVDPWGRVLADAGEQPGFVVADVDPAETARARAQIPALEHDRPCPLPAVAEIDYRVGTGD